jgi:quinone-modifying oxidoreductase subunit QmoC
VLAALRRHAVHHFAIPRFLARWVNQASMLPVTLLVPVVLLALAVMARDPIAAAFGLEAESALYAEFFPHWMLIGLFGSLTTLTFVLALVSLARFWGAMRAADEAAGTYRAAAGLVASLALALKSVLAHDRFGFCQAQAPRRVSHLALFYGFLALFVVTIWATIDLYLNPLLGIEARYPFGLLHPMKLLANVGGVALVFGAVKVVRSRLEGAKGTPVSTAFDWTLVWVVLGVGVTGFAAEVFRFTIAPDSGLRTLAWSVYFVHLVLVFQLLVYLPYSKLAHVLYRTVAMAYAEHTGRYRPVRRRPAGGAALPATTAGPALGAGGS